MIDTFALKRARAERKVTQVELQKALNLSPRSYSLKENGKTHFNHSEIVKLAKFLSLSLTEVNLIFFANSLTDSVNVFNSSNIITNC